MAPQLENMPGPAEFAALLTRITGKECSRARAGAIKTGRSMAASALMTLVSNPDVRAAIDAAYPAGKGEAKGYVTLYATIYDGNPNESGPCAWPEFTDVSYRGRSIGSITRHVLDDAVRQARECGQYDHTDTLWYKIRDGNGRIVAAGEF